MSFMLRAATFIVAIFVFIVSSSISYASDRWEYLGIPVYYGTDMKLDAAYIDTKTLQYDDSTGIARFWVKTTSRETVMHMVYMEYDFSNKSIRVLREQHAWDKDKITNYKNPQWKKISFEYNPGIDIELAVDYICERYNLPLQHLSNSERWKWLMSTDDCTITYSVDSVRMDSVNHTVNFIANLKYTNGLEYTNEFKIDFANYKYNRYWKGLETRDIVPDTFYELFADAVENRIGKP